MFISGMNQPPVSRLDTQKIANYLLAEKIYESANSLVYQAIRQSDGLACIVKILKQDYPTPQELTRYRQEYQITEQLNLDGVIDVYALEPCDRTLAIILEDFGATSLAQLFQDSLLPFQRGDFQTRIAEFLHLAIAIVEILGQIHAEKIIHKDINPSNIVLNPETKEVKIIDFGISTILTVENPTLKHPNVLEGTLAYISPEQTGRMNRSLDYRSDFYSLGVTFYELLTGKLPFATTNLMELVHCHIARQPVPPHELFGSQHKNAIPVTISQIITKLLAKTAEERYQSAWGLKADLEKSLRQWETHSQITEFTLGDRDVAPDFRIPQKLYGRKREIATLLTAFEKVATGAVDPAKMIMVAGYSGIGKSALVREIYKPITAKQGYFIFGKFDQFQRNVPYSAIVFAFQGLVKQLLTENTGELDYWREKLLAALGKNGGIIADVIPEIELIIGKQPSPASLGAAETQNRFNLTFRNFIKVFCTKEHPLVIFLDDLQWADLATLKLIELIVTDRELDYLFIIGAYRDNEVNAGHLLQITLEEIRKQGLNLQQITLKPLGFGCVSQLLSDTLLGDRPTVEPLAELVMQKTEGNPFFVNQFLTALYLENLLNFDREQLCWEWDLERIEALELADNVVELMIAKIKKLPLTTQKIISLAACVGAFFDIKTLAIVCQQSPAKIYYHLLPALQLGLVTPLSELNSQLLIQNHKFSHDRIQQAADSLIYEDKKAVIHLQIGKLLLSELNPQELTERLFEVVDHLNFGRNLTRNQSERIKFARLNLQAALRAKQATAYGSALEYLNLGIGYLGDRQWQANYPLTLELHREKLELEYLNGNYQASESVIQLVLAKVDSALEQADVHNSAILLATILGKYRDALAIGIKALKLLNLELPETNWAEALNAEVKQAQQNLADRPIATLVDDPEMILPEKKVAVKLLINLLTPAYFLDQHLFALIATKCSNLCFQYGTIPEAAMAYSCYATILVWHSQETQLAYQLGLLSLKISDRFNDLAYRCRACNMLANHIMPWVKHCSFSYVINDEAYQVGLEAGDIQFVGFSTINKLGQRLFVGNNLEEILTVLPEHLAFASKPKNITVLDALLARQLIILNLTGKTQDKFSFSSQELTEAEFIATCETHQDYYSLCIYYILKAQVLYLYAEYELALACVSAAEPWLFLVRGLIPQAEHNYFSSLIILALYPQLDPQKQAESWQKLVTNQQQLKSWADDCPENFLHKYLLVRAEIAKVEGQGLSAMELYDLAIASARDREFTNDEALANELAAKFWLAHHKPDFARLYLQKAHHSYQIWGATAKVTDLEGQYPQLLTEISREGDHRNIVQITHNSTNSSNSSTLDFTSIIKASQALAREIVLDKLLKKLMQILIENAGAQRGFLLLKEGDTWSIAAEARTNEPDPILLQSTPVNTHESDPQALFSTAIINYIDRTQESVVLPNATHEGQFMRDPYIIHSQPKSILGAPLLNHGKLVGLLYLENNLTTGAFTPERVEILTILSAQATISIENSRLYSQLEDYNNTLEHEVSERTQDLRLANQELERLVNLDGLTQVANRRYFDEYLLQQWENLAQDRNPLALILFDVDFFKRYNDHYGHQAGDNCLTQIAKAAQKAVKRPKDLVARYGGEEFVIVLPNTDLAGACIVAQRVQAEITNCAIAHAKSEVSPFITVSMGIHSQIPANNNQARNTQQANCKQLIKKADTALYQAKKAGRNRYQSISSKS